MHYIQENQYHVIFISFFAFQWKILPRLWVYSLVLSGHIPTKNLSKSPPPHLGEQNFPTQTWNIFATLFHGILAFFQELPSGGGGDAISIVLGPSFRQKSPRWTKGLRRAPLAHCGRTPSYVYPVNSEFLPSSIHQPHFTILPLSEGFFSPYLFHIFLEF